MNPIRWMSENFTNRNTLFSSESNGIINGALYSNRRTQVYCEPSETVPEVNNSNHTNHPRPNIIIRFCRLVWYYIVQCWEILKKSFFFVLRFMFPHDSVAVPSVWVVEVDPGPYFNSGCAQMEDMMRVEFPSKQEADSYVENLKQEAINCGFQLTFPIKVYCKPVNQESATEDWPFGRDGPSYSSI